MIKFWLAIAAVIGLAFALGVQILVWNQPLPFSLPHFKNQESQKVGAGSENSLHISALDQMAERVVAECAVSVYKPTCYEEVIPKLMEEISMEQAFDVTVKVQNLDPEYAYCHVLGHKLSARETAKDPSAWKDVIARCPSGVCSNGCIHGAFQERFRAENLSREEIKYHFLELSTVCEPRPNWQPTGLEQATCYHALGHLFMYITNADINYSIELCDRVREANISTGKDFSQLCFDGAFMQIFQPLENEDFALVEGKVPIKEEMGEFCKPFIGPARQPCWSESWPLVRDQILQPKGLEQFCDNKILLTEADHERCYRGMYYVVAAQLQLDDKKMREFCAGATLERQPACYANFASRLIETDFRNIHRAVDICEYAAGEARKACFAEMFTIASYDFQSGSSEQLELCALLPQKWQEKCGE